MTTQDAIHIAEGFKVVNPDVIKAIDKLLEAAEYLENLPDHILNLSYDDDRWGPAWTPKEVARHIRERW